MTGARSVARRLVLGVIAALSACTLVYALRPRAHSAAPARERVFETPGVHFHFNPGSGELTVSSRDGANGFDVDLALVVDGEPRSLTLAGEDIRNSADALRASAHVLIGGARVDVGVELRADPARDSLSVGLSVPSAAIGHGVALRAELGSGGQVVFVSGVGQIADRGGVSGHALLVDSEPHPLGIIAAAGSLTIDALPESATLPVEPIHLSVTSAAARDGHPSDLEFVLGSSSAAIWRALAEIVGVPTASLHGRVTGTAGPSLIFGRDAADHPLIRAHVGDTGTFALDVPTSVVKWYAAMDPGRASSLTWFAPGTSRDLVLDVSPGGELRVKIVDADTNRPLTARLLVHGIDGTVDPSFGPDYRASGAGPIVDALRGEVTTPLPSGRYRVSATKGIEWSIDANDIDMTPGTVTEVVLRPRHVVPTPGVLGCDLHVHARPSFDTPVTPEDRVLSLVAAGVDFAVPTEHNLVGDYSSALETLDLGRELLSVPGVEVTTMGKGFGHFGVFPFPREGAVPPFRHTTMGAIFRAVRTGDPERYFQLNHPRLPRGIGYFNKIAFDPNAPREGIRARIDFDGIEVYSGYDTEFPARVEQVMRDYWALLNFGWRYVATGSSDSHRIQFHWAGYPRTMVTVDPDATAENDVRPADPLLVVANVKEGHAVVTSGPILEFQLAGARPGDEVVTQDDPMHGHVRVRAAPWVDVTNVDVVVGTVGGSSKTLQSFALTSREAQVGPEPGSLREAQNRTIRLDRDIDVPVGPDNGWVQIIARGDRKMDDVLPFMPVPPLAFTNPVYVVRHPVPPPAFPGVDAGGSRQR
jgi:hypothetical protein